MSYTGGGMYDVSRCPLCGELMWNGLCENLDCQYHWVPLDEDCGDEKTQEEQKRRIKLRPDGLMLIRGNISDIVYERCNDERGKQNGDI